MKCSMVPADMIDTCWAQVEPLLAKACKFTYGRYATQDIYEMVDEGLMQLWVAFEAGEEGTIIKGAVVTQLMTYPRSKFLSLVLCGGEGFREWRTPIMELFRNFARDMACDGIEATARRGWAKLLKDEGYKARWVAFELPI